MPTRVPILVKRPLIAVPRLLAPVIIASAIKTAIKLYSIAVAPVSSFANLTIRFFMFHSVYFRAVPVVTLQLANSLTAMIYTQVKPIG